MVQMVQVQYQIVLKDFCLVHCLKDSYFISNPYLIAKQKLFHSYPSAFPDDFSIVLLDAKGFGQFSKLETSLKNLYPLYTLSRTN